MAEVPQCSPRLPLHRSGRQFHAAQESPSRDSSSARCSLTSVHPLALSDGQGTSRPSPLRLRIFPVQGSNGLQVLVTRTGLAGFPAVDGLCGGADQQANVGR
jgi:hypothetical protein